MSSPSQPVLRKRPLQDCTRTEDCASSIPKRHRTDTSHCYSPRFWDTLSKVPLTRGALKELDRRSDLSRHPLTPGTRRTDATRRLLRSDHRRLKQLATGGGPDLSVLRGCSVVPTANIAMSQSNSQSRKRQASGSSKSSVTGRTRNTTPYSGEFEQKLIDRGVYPKAYRALDGSRPPKPENYQDICAVLQKARSSLSPSTFSETTFEEFQDMTERATSESKAMAQVIPIIAGSNDKQYETAGDIPFTSLKKFDPDLSNPRPDYYYGVNPSQIDHAVRRDLAEYIIPSKRTNLPAAPNFFLEGKSASGKPDVAQRQAMYDGAIGARGMFYLQNYGQPTPAYDGNAYTITSTYSDGQLKMYATHPKGLTGAMGEPEYHMTQLGAYALTHSQDSFRSGAAAFRNARAWTLQQREQLIANANASVQRQSVETRPFSRTESDCNDASRLTESFDSETSADELALDHSSTAKRLRRQNSLD